MAGFLDVGYLAAAGAGLLSFLSPCVLPLVPPYLCFLGGVSVAELQASEAGSATRRRVMIAALAFVAGFSTVFVALGASASLMGQLVAEWSGVLSKVAGALVLVMGLHFLGVFRIATLYREARFSPAKPVGPLGAYLVGMAFAFGWTPCVGPVLSAVLFMAAAEETLGQGALLLLAYAAGLGVPFLTVALLLDTALGALRRLRPWMPTIERTTGALLVVTGLLFLTGSTSEIAYWLLEAFPALGRIG